MNTIMAVGHLRMKRQNIYLWVPSSYLESIKERWLNKTLINFDSLSINEKTFKEMMIDKDCFGENPINGYRLNIDTPFLDIGIPSSYNKSQTFIPNIIREMKMND